MKIKALQNLFWFLKPKTSLDLSDASTLDMYVQQTLTCGTADNVRKLLRTINITEFRKAFQRIQHFLPKEVKMFWEDFFANY